MAIDDKKMLFEDLKEDLMFHEDRIVFSDDRLRIAFSILCGLVEKRIADAKEEIIQAIKRDISPL